LIHKAVIEEFLNLSREESKQKNELFVKEDLVELKLEKTTQEKSKVMEF
jgi:hypothetical protein